MATTKRKAPAKTAQVELKAAKPETAIAAALKKAVAADLKNAKGSNGEIAPKAKTSIEVKIKAKAPAKAVAAQIAPTPAAAARKVVAETARAYLPAADRRKLMDAAIAKLLKRDGIAALTRTAAAAACGVSNGLIGAYYTNAAGLKIAAVQYAADAGDLKTVKKAIADGFQVKLLTRKAQQAVKS